MIKSFKDYINEELKPSTYEDAAKKLNKLGGTHKERGENLLKWVDIVKKKKSTERSKQYGEYSMNYQVISGISRKINTTTREPINYEFTEIYHKGYNYKQPINTDIISVMKGPNKCYISAISCTNPEEEYTPEDMTLIQNIDFCVWIIDTESGISSSAFNYQIPIKWLDNETFELEGTIDIDSGWNDDESRILFSDRVNAVRFKRMLKRDNIIKLLNFESGYIDDFTGKKETYYDCLRKFFMEYSTSEEMEKAFKLIESVPINKLWD